MVTEDDLIRTVSTAYENGWRQVKLYFMCGLPTEEDEDVLAIVMAKRVIQAGREATGRRTSAAPCPSAGSCRSRTRRSSGPRSATTRPSTAACTHSRTPCAATRSTAAPSACATTTGSRPSSGPAVARRPSRRQGHPRRLGGRGPLRRLERALLLRALDGVRREGVRRRARRPGLYTVRERDEVEVLPWDHLDAGLDREWLWQDWQDAVDETEVEDCRWTPCYDCGVCPTMGTEIQIGPTGRKLLPSRWSDDPRGRPHVRKRLRERPELRGSRPYGTRAWPNGARGPVLYRRPSFRLDTSRKDQNPGTHAGGSGAGPRDPATARPLRQAGQAAVHEPPRHFPGRGTRRQARRDPCRVQRRIHPPPEDLVCGCGGDGVASEAEYLEIGLTAPRDPARVRADLDAALPPGSTSSMSYPSGLDAAKRFEAERVRGSAPGVRMADQAGRRVGRRRRRGRGRASWPPRTSRWNVSPRRDGAVSTCAPPCPRVSWTGAPRRRRMPCAILRMVVRHSTPAVRPDDILTGLRQVADLAPPSPPLVTRLAQGPLDADTGGLADP